MTVIVGNRPGTGKLRGPDEAALKEKMDGDRRTYLLDGEDLRNDEVVELRLRGNRGWIPARVTGLPRKLEVIWQAEDGRELRTSLSPGVGIRRP